MKVNITSKNQARNQGKSLWMGARETRRRSLDSIDSWLSENSECFFLKRVEIGWPSSPASGRASYWTGPAKPFAFEYVISRESTEIGLVLDAFGPGIGSSPPKPRLVNMPVVS